MEIINAQAFSEGFYLLINSGWVLVLAALLGLVIGILFGAIPGFSVTLGMALMIIPSLAFPLVPGIVFLSSIYTGGVYGGGITAILLNIPGTPAAVATSYDGYPMAKAGLQYQALSLSLAASVLGVLFSYIALLFFIQPLARFVLLFGPPEMLAVVFFAFTIIGLFRGDLVKGIIAGFLGLFLGTIGTDAMATTRGTFGLMELYDGIPIIPAMVGIFAVPEFFSLVTKKSIVDETVKTIILSPIQFLKLFVNTCFEVFRYKKTVIRSSLIGLFIGLVPAAGANIASIISYGQAMNASKNRDNFGKGEPEGVVAAEVGNNASEAGSMATMLAFGIPGSSAAAILMAALFVHGLTPGPYLMRDSMSFVYAIIGSNFLQTILLIPVGIIILSFIGRLVHVPSKILVPILCVTITLGAIASREYYIDAVIMLIFGFLGYILNELDYPLISVILGLMLGRMLDQQLARTISLFSNNPELLFVRPIFLVFVLLSIGCIVISIWQRKGKKRSK